ncbi:MAG: amidohydrolase [Ruminococcus sp.]|nr:amidohydrolase [Ruminococcus sp.]
MILKNATIHTMNDNGDVIENGFVETDGKTIKSVGAGNPQEGIDLNGADIYPGFIDAHSHLGLFTSGVGIEGEDFNEDSDPVTPQLDTKDAIYPLDSSFADAVSAGVTTSVVSPGSTNTIAGKISAIKTQGKRIDDMIIRTVGMKFSLGENPKMTYIDKDSSPVTRMAIASLIREALSKAKRYMEQKQKAESIDDEPEFDAKCEALIPLLKREIKAHFHCHRADDIFTAIRISKEFNLDCVLIHCTEGHLIADELKGENISCVLGPLLCDRSKPELANLNDKNPSILCSEGIDIAICTDHSEVPVQYLPLSVGVAIKNGLSFSDGLKSITCNAAKAAGIYDRVGSIETGKDADFAIFDSNPFEVMSSPVMVVSDGRIVYERN